MGYDFHFFLSSLECSPHEAAVVIVLYVGCLGKTGSESSAEFMFEQEFKGVACVGDY